jgi:ABC-type transport system involved in cytochrome c biogenesis ATPase subunit/GNAT superfamily N-acetyltransferase
MRRRRDAFRVHQIRRTYDREANRFTFNICYETHTEPTPRSLVVAEAFGLGIDETEKFPLLDAELKIRPTDIVYVTGDSGSGKSVLLRAIKQDLGEEAVDISEVEVDDDKPLIETVGVTVEEGLELLSKVGLNDAFLFLRTYRQLSDGQKYRYRIAKLIESGRQWWLMDEFAATLDRDIAKIVAFNLQKLARQQGKAVIAATTHGDLNEDLAPNVLVEKRFGKEISVSYFPDAETSECSLVKEMRVEAGSTKDWQALSCFHYRGHRCSPPRRIFRLMRKDELCGVIVYSYPPPACYGRRLVLPRMDMSELNSKLSTINRVVIHPKYRTIGLGAKLIRETLALAGTPFVELVAVMAKYSPFAQKAGMQKVATQQHSKEIMLVARALEDNGFDLRLLSSQKYDLGKIEALSGEQLEFLRDCLQRCGQPRFRKEFAISRHVPFGNSADFKKCINDEDISKLTRLVKIVGMLLQTKVYLFWGKMKSNYEREISP